jgi:hypothetical protein
MTRIRTLIATLVGVPLLALALATSPASATTPPGSIQIYNQVQLVSPLQAIVTITYKCSPAASGSTTGVILTSVEQNSNISNGSSVAICDDRSQTTAVETTGGPLAPGAAAAAAAVENSDQTSFAFDSRGVMIR